MSRYRHLLTVCVIALLSTILLAGCGSKGGEQEFKGDHPALQFEPEDRALAVLAALWSGEMEEREQTALLMPLLDLAVPDAMANSTYDSCESVDNPSFATMSMQGSTSVFGSESQQIALSSQTSYCWNQFGQPNDNSANQLFKAFQMNGVVATCSWGETYNLSGTGAYQAVAATSKDVYGAFNISGASVNSSFDCTMSLENSEADESTAFGDAVQGGTCTDSAGNEWSTWSQVNAGESCVLTVGNTAIYDPPNAVCGDDATVYTLTDAYFDGSGSTHPNGQPLTYSWTVTPPAGSAATMQNATSTTPYAFTDLAGDYLGQLTVSGPDGQTSTCTQTITAIPYENFRAELYWLTHTDDLDLHLLRPDQPNGLRSYGDCFYANMNPNWGDPNESADDPSLDVDDIWGFGPENINIDDPAMDPNYLGWYRIVVHDYPWTVWDETPNEAVVNIYLDGVLTRTYNLTITGDNQYWYVAKIHWPSGIIVDCNGLGGCP